MSIPLTAQESAQKPTPQKTTVDVRTGATEHADPAPPLSEELAKEP